MIWAFLWTELGISVGLGGLSCISGRARIIKCDGGGRAKHFLSFRSLCWTRLEDLSQVESCINSTTAFVCVYMFGYLYNRRIGHSWSIVCILYIFEEILLYHIVVVYSNSKANCVLAKLQLQYTPSYMHQFISIKLYVIRKVGGGGTPW